MSKKNAQRHPTDLNVAWHPTEQQPSPQVRDRGRAKAPPQPEVPSAPTPYADIFTRFAVEPEFYAAFAAFVETGTAPAEFTYRLEQNAHWQLALEEAFERRVGRLQEVLRVLLPTEEKTEDGGR